MKTKTTILSTVLALALASPALAKKPIPTPTAPVATATPAPPKPVKPGDKLPKFTVATQILKKPGDATKVKKGKVDSTRLKRPTAFLVVGTGCPTTQVYAARLAALETAFKGKVDFVYLFPNRDETPEGVLGFHAKHKLTGQIARETAGQVARQLGATRTAEAYVVGKDGKVVYHGAIDDNKGDPAAVKEKYLENALTAAVTKKPLATTETQVQA